METDLFSTCYNIYFFNVFQVSAAADEVNAPVALGDELYAECCIDIGAGDSRSYFSKTNLCCDNENK